MRKVVEDGEAPDPAATFQRRGCRARRYWGKVNRGIKNFRRRRARRRVSHAKADGVAKSVSGVQGRCGGDGGVGVGVVVHDVGVGV